MVSIMEGYDTLILGSFYALPQFAQKYGVPIGNGTYTVLATWQTALSTGVIVGELFGLVFAGLITDKYGYKPTMLINVSVTPCSAYA